MINLQNPSIPVQANPIEIDRAIVDLQTKLSDNITWLTHGYGRAYKNLDLTQNRTVFYPEVYLGTQNNSQRYTNISPDNDKTGQCFFLVTQELVNEFQQGQYAYLEYDVAIIFSVNLELINSTLLATDYFLQNCVAEVRNCLTRIPTGAPYQLVINDAQFLFEDVFAEFDLNDAQVLEKAPLTHFRLNTTITLQEECITYTPTPPEPPETDLILWLKADAGINGGNPVPGELINTWADQSGNNNDFTQLVGSRQPEYKPLGNLGVPCVYFDGIASIDKLNSPIYTNNTDCTFFIVAQQLVSPAVPNNGGSFLTQRLAFTQDNFFTLYSERVPAFGNNIYFYSGTGSTANQSLGTQDNLPHYLGVCKNATTANYYRDSFTPLATNPISQDWTVFDNHYIGSQTGVGAFMIGDIYEVMMWDRELTPTEMSDLEAYFLSKYGL
jgi:hypothetical protein